jgi:hypothetical protein
MSLSKTALLLAFLTFASSHSVAAQSVTAFGTGEQTTGMTKQCFYDGLGSVYTRTMSSIDICPLSIKVEPSVRRSQAVTSSPRDEPQPYTTGFKTGELTTGMTKQCFYDALGSTYTQTMSSIDLCPLSIKIKRR